LISATPPAGAAAERAGPLTDLVWRIPDGQRLVFEEFDDGIVMFDAGVGATHLLNATAAEALAILEAEPRLDAEALRRRLLDGLPIADAALPLDAVQEMLLRLEDLGLVRAESR
jgi:PqqD family protein of HPr-rel-A system